MTEPVNSSKDIKRDPKQVTRRRFIAGLAGTGVVAAGTIAAVSKTGDKDKLSLNNKKLFTNPADPEVIADSNVNTGTTLLANDKRVGEGLATPGAVADRILVVVELSGGNDGPSTVIPYGDGKYYDLRPNLSISKKDVVPIDDYIGLNPELINLSKRQFAVVEGIGNTSNNLSHFVNRRIWHRAGQSSSSSGYLASLADCLASNKSKEALIALSVAGYAPQLNGISANSLILSNFNNLGYLSKDKVLEGVYRDSVQQFEGGALTNLLSKNWLELFSVGGKLPGIPKIAEKDPMIIEGKTLGRQLWVAADFIKSDVGIQVIHAKLGGFDTHVNHKSKHRRLMKEVNFAIDGFLQKIADAGMQDRVLVALTSEFGRRGQENGQGFDHGNGSTLMVFGPVVPGRHGVTNTFSNLDKSGNFKTQIPYDSYLKTLSSEWLGCEEILSDSEAIPGLI